MRNSTRTGSLCAGLLLAATGLSEASQQPNVLFIAIDDLNDWTGVLGGHPQAKTPNIDRLAAEGINFTNAHCDAPACGPSRAAILTGIRPHRSGVYRNNHKSYQRSEVLSASTQLPMHFRNNGYYTAVTGKVHHERWLEHIGEADGWVDAWPSKRDVVAYSPWPRGPDGSPLRGGNPRLPDDFDWYALEDDLMDDMADVKSANWIIDQLQKEHDQPFFLAFGIFRPHLPWYVPQRFFDMHPLEDIILPVVPDDELDDVPAIGIRHAYIDSNNHRMTVESGLWEEAVQAYLASSSFADYCVGMVLDALDQSPYRDNTIVVLWSDHGYHLGEKHKWHKFSLWERATRAPFMWRVPGIEPGETDIPVNLSDIYPTLIELCGLPGPVQELDGISLVPFMMDPAKESERPALTAHWYDCYSLRTREWRYIRYSDGSEELYNRRFDPNEWTNLALNPEYEAVKRAIAKWLPKKSAPELEVIPVRPPE